MTSTGGTSYEDVFDALSDAILVVDVDGRIRSSNDRVADVFGYTPEELQDEPVELLVPEGLQEAHVDLRDGFFDDPETRPMGVGLDLHARRKDGATVPVDIGLSPMTVDEELAVVASVRDVTQQVAAETKYRAILETVPDAVFVADAATGEIVEVNDEAVDLTGYAKDELVGRNQTELHPDGEAERYRALFERHIESEAVISQLPDGSSIYVETKEGERVPVEINVSVFELGEDVLITGSFRDVSERLARERELARQNERLNEFVGVVSHDLRNPLNVAAGRLELARDDCESTHLDRMGTALDRMGALIDDLLALAREGESVTAVEPVDLELAAERGWQTVDTETATLVVEADRVLQADEGRLQQLLENLVRNAVDHAGPDVTVTVGALEDGFFVEDDGPGIPEDDLEQVFESGYTTDEDGTGFGLGIVRQIAEAHGWSVRATEGREGGARFEITGVDPG